MNAPKDAIVTQPDPLVIAGRAYRSRLLVGTGKYRNFQATRAAIDASGAEIVTVAIRRTNIGQNPDEPSLLGSCYRTCMQLADERGVSTIAFPAISTGVYGYPLAAAAGMP